MAFVWLLIFGVSFTALGVAAGPSTERRPHFWALLPLATLIAGCLVVLAVAVSPRGSMGAVMGFLGLLALPALMLAPAMLYRRPGPSSDSGEDGGGGRGPDAPPSPPPAPRGGIPLPDAEPASVRRRDHHAARLSDRRPRRPSREPETAPTPRPPVHR
jgi:hypothetical protein